MKSGVGWRRETGCAVLVKGGRGEGLMACQVLAGECLRRREKGHMLFCSNNFPYPKLSSCLHVVRLPTLFTSPGSWKDLARARACVFAKGSLIKALHHASRDAAENKHG